MNCAECKELLVAYIEGLLDKSQNQIVAEHLKDCRTCQAEVKQLSNLQDRLVRNGNNLASSNLEDDVMNKILQEQTARSKAASKAGTGLKLRRIIMKSPIVKLAAAAVIIIGVFAVINSYMGTGSSVALADVLEKIEQVQAFMYRMKMTMTGNMMPNMPTGKQEMESTVTISNEYGMKLEVNITESTTGQIMTQQMYVLPDQKVMLMLMPQQKKYVRMEFDDDLLARMKKQNNDPREMIKQIIGCKYTDLGRSVIDGIEVEGFQTTDAKFMAGMAEDVNVKLWVDIKSWLPVQQELYIKVNEQMEMHGVVYDYQWDIPVDKSEFEPVIPNDFTGFPGGSIKMPEVSEKAAIEGLRFVAELFGQYPKNLNMINLMQEVIKLKDSNSPAAEQLRQELKEGGSEEEKAIKIMEVMQPIQSLGMFYMTLVQDKKEPAYYGQSVDPNDADAVLMRWKVSENQYRVIYGDLTAEDVTAEELAELEKPLLEQ